MKKSIKTVAQKVMQLGYFGQRHGFNTNIANWSLVRNLKDETITPAIYIGDDMFIDILNDKMSCLDDSLVYDQVTVQKLSNGYLFKGDKVSYYLDSSRIYKLYD